MPKHTFGPCLCVQVGYRALRYTQALLTQMSQTAMCNRHHSVDQQLCRWLLLTLDRLPPNELTTTQELIANMLGVRREGVTEAAGRLQSAGSIHYSRGHITVLDRPGLEKRACECYQVAKREFDRLLQYAIDVTGSVIRIATAKRSRNLLAAAPGAQRIAPKLFVVHDNLSRHLSEPVLD